jgi:ribosomal protein S18 acetylase RimI-like enzyme
MALTTHNAGAPASVKPTKVAYRRARKADLVTIAALDGIIYAVEGGWSLDDFYQDFSNPNSYYLLAIVDSEIVGYAACCISRRRGELTVNTVLPEYRGLGIGRELLKRRLRWLDRRVRTTVLQTRIDNDLVLDGYPNHGFKPSKVLNDYYGPGRHAQEMRRIRPGA